MGFGWWAAVEGGERERDTGGSDRIEHSKQVPRESNEMDGIRYKVWRETLLLSREKRREALCSYKLVSVLRLEEAKGRLEICLEEIAMLGCVR
jgi:hypothetical protein